MFNAQFTIHHAEPAMKQLMIAALTVVLLLVAHPRLHAVTDPPKDSVGIVRDSIVDSVRVVIADPKTPSPKESFKRKKLITSILAFPIPFGFSGMHRIYLGTEPWVPVVYLCTGGGGAGLLPFIDFLLIVTATEEQFKQYENNPNVFMFVK